MDHRLLPRVEDSFKYYKYEPNLPAAAIFLALFTLTTALHSFQMLRSRTWFMIPFLIGGLFEVGGYACRLIAATENPGPYCFAPFITQSILVLVAPTLFAASIYMELGRIVMMIKGENALFIRRTWLTKIFVAGDVFAFGIQSCGASLLSSDTPSTVNTGSTIIIVGLVTQVLSFGLFVVAAALFHIRMAKRQTELSHGRPWSRHMISLYIISGLIFIRSIVRVVEYIQGNSGYIMTHEIFIYIFDAALMFLAMATMNAIHPGEVKKYIFEMRRADRQKSSGSQDSSHAMMDMA